MKTLVVYYSFEGNTGFIAEQIKTAASADILRLELTEDKKRSGLSKYIWGGRQVMTHKKPALKPYDVQIDPYDLIIIGGPVWAGSPAPALSSFLARTKIENKRVALFCCHAGGKGRALEKLKALLSGNTFAGEVSFVNPLKGDRQEQIHTVTGWVSGLLENPR
ncbi:MAG: NAD(P)H-dependent oxidoreductase [Treponema sp.]|jgi:flavodoxin|nr:NAD(P)H-dependent oxidoreductase [Treponema sp.]